MNTNCFKPPMNIAIRDFKKKYCFLAGSIEQGQAEDWQTEMTYFFRDYNWGIFNPRRDKWDSTLEQKFENPTFYQQVMWELNALENADMILMYLQPGTKSPISLAEFGLYAQSRKLFVVCPDNFWRKGNVDIMAHKYNIPLFKSFDDFIDYFAKNKGNV